MPSRRGGGAGRATRDTVNLVQYKEKRNLTEDMLDGIGSSHLNGEMMLGLLQGDG